MEHRCNYIQTKLKDAENTSQKVPLSEKKITSHYTFQMYFAVIEERWFNRLQSNFIFQRFYTNIWCILHSKIQSTH